jgi:hypothetical protein
MTFTPKFKARPSRGPKALFPKASLELACQTCYTLYSVEIEIVRPTTMNHSLVEEYRNKPKP